jgi:hypothetical protein
VTIARGGAWGVALGACAALAIACGAAIQAKPEAPRAAKTMDAGRPGGDHAQIQQLADDIRSREQAAGLPPNTEPYDAHRGEGVCSVSSTSETCVDACNLGDAICDDAKKICDLADQLPGDAWASERCDAGKASCQRARERCCDCK